MKLKYLIPVLIVFKPALGEDLASQTVTLPPDHVKAIIPTAPGQIGINPVSVPNIPDSELTASPVGQAASLVTIVGGTTKWIGPGADAAPTTATTTITIKGKVTAVPYVPQDLTFDIASDGTMTVTFGEWIRQRLQTIAAKVVPCAGGAKIRKRQAACGFGSYTQLVREDQELIIRLRGASPEPVEQFMQEVVTSDAERAGALVEVGAGAAPAAGAGAGAGIGGAVAGLGGVSSLIGIIYFSWPSQSTSVGSGSTGGKIAPIVKIKPNPSNGKTEPGNEDKDKDSCNKVFRCGDDQCKGIPTVKRDQKCTVEKNKNCRCVPGSVSISEQNADRMDDELWNAVQSVLGGNGSEPPICSNDMYAVESKVAKALAKAFCANGLENTKTATLKNMDAIGAGLTESDMSVYKDLKFHYSWQPTRGNCQPSDCESLFDKLISSCASGSNSLSVSARAQTDCATGFWIFNGPKPPSGWGGICNLKMQEVTTCETSDSNLHATIEALWLTQPNESIYKEDKRTPINDKVPWSLAVPHFNNPLIVTGEHTGDYVQFVMGKSSWTSSDTWDANNASSQGGCKVGKWDKTAPDGRPLPNCNSIFEKNSVSTRSLECSWRC